MTDTIDPVMLALVQNRLDHISHQMGWVMTRTARSPIFSQSHDFSCFLADARGTLISQADGIPIHTGGGGFAVRAILRDFAGRIEPEGVFLLNDPYTAGGNHLPDWVIARPVFSGGQLMAFACNRAHQADIGGPVERDPQAVEAGTEVSAGSGYTKSAEGQVLIFPRSLLTLFLSFLTQTASIRIEC